MPNSKREQRMAKVAKATAEAIGLTRRLPTHRPPTHPGKMLLEEFLKPLAVTQAEFSRRIKISYPRLNAIIRGRRGITVDVALRLARALGTTADIWLDLQLKWDLWHALRSPEGKRIAKLRPLETVIYRPGMTRSGQTDWKRLDEMTDEEIQEQIKNDPDVAPEADESWMADAQIVLPGRKPVPYRPRSQ